MKRRATKKTLPTDAVFTGAMGLYALVLGTNAARRWARRHLVPQGERTTAVEGSRECRAIIAAMDRAGLRVVVNGEDMAGFGRKEGKAS